MIASLFDRSDYAALEKSVYLNQASLGLIGQPAVSAMHAFLDEIGRHGNLHMSDSDEVAFLESLRERAAKILHGDPTYVAILSSASELLGQLPMLLRPAEGSNVLAVASDFPALTRPWLRHAALHDCDVRFVEDGSGTDLTDALIEAIDEQTAVVAVSSVQYATGTVVDIRRMRRATKQVGANLIVDATQAAGAVRVDANAWEADVVVTSGYKWLGGHGGVALAVMSPELLEQTPPLPGWMSAPDPFGFDATSLSFANDARRYTLSTMSYVSIVGLTAALNELLTVGEERVEAHARKLAGKLIDAVAVHDWFPFRKPDDSAGSSHILSLTHSAIDAEETIDALRRRQIVCGIRNGGIRVSIAPYNDEQDVTALVEALAVPDRKRF